MKNIEHTGSGQEEVGLTELERRFDIRHSLERITGKVELLVNSMVFLHKKQTIGETLTPEEVQVIKNAYSCITDFLAPIINTVDKK